jgi:hypothetical protein
VLLTAAVAMVAALLGLLVGNAISGSSSSGSSLNRHASVGPLRVSFPAGWVEQAAPATPKLGLSNEFALARRSGGGGTLLIGTGSGSSTSLLPESVVIALASRPAPQVVTLGGARYHRYLNLPLAGVTGSASLYALPTTIGTVVGICEQGRAGSGFAAECERVVATIRPVAGSVLPLGSSSSYATALNAAVAKLNAASSAADTQLHAARTPAAQARAANAIAIAYSRAAATIAGLSAGPARVQNLAFAAALRRTATAYGALARAISRGDARGYGAARASIAGASSAVNSTLSQLTKVVPG